MLLLTLARFEIHRSVAVVLALTTGEYVRKWAWLRHSGRGFKIFAPASHAFEQIEPLWWKSWIRPCTINDLAIERVDHFKYLGVWLSHNLTWNKHIEEICKNASKQIGMIYRRFYQNSSKETLLQLYVSLIRPCLEYAAPVWDPSLQILTQAVEKVQEFAMKICLKNWSGSYDELLRDSKLPPLKDRRLLLKFSYLFQVINRSFSFPNAPLTLHQTLSLRNSES